MLSHLRISSAKPAAKPFNLSDGHGLFLTVQPNGSKLWKLSFRHLGKQKTLHLGLWPDVGLADTRDRRDEARRPIAAGLDPAVEKKRARVAAKVAAANTFKDVAEEWVQKCEREGRAEITLSIARSCSASRPARAPARFGGSAPVPTHVHRAGRSPTLRSA